jgi:hypothetical protein
LSKRSQFLARKLAFTRKFEGKLEHSRLLLARETNDFVNDFRGGHSQSLLEITFASSGFMTLCEKAAEGSRTAMSCVKYRERVLVFFIKSFFSGFLSVGSGY